MMVLSAVMSIEHPDARLRERGVIPARGGTTSLRSVINILLSVVDPVTIIFYFRTLLFVAFHYNHSKNVHVIIRI